MEYVILTFIFPFVFILFGHLLSYNDHLKLNRVVSCYLFTFVFNLIIQRFWIFQYLLLVPCIALCTVDLLLNDIINEDLYLLYGIILSVIWYHSVCHSDIFRGNFITFIKRQWNNKSANIIWSVLWLLNVLFVMCVFDYGTKFVMEQSFGRFVTNIDTNSNSNLQGKMKVLGKIDGTDKISEMKHAKWDRDDLSNLDNISPTCRRKYERYIGEKVMFECKWNTADVQITDYSVFWTINGSEIDKTERISLTENKNGDFHAHALIVLSINEKDFGEYNLWASVNQTNNNIQQCTVGDFLIAHMILTEAAGKINYVHVPVGNAVLLKYELPFENSVDDNSFTFEYKIDSKLIGEISLERHSERFSTGCSIFTKLILRNIKTNQLEYGMTNDQKHIQVYICTLALSFGKHSVIVSRTVLNQTDKITLPTKFIILPKKFNCIENENCDEHLMTNDNERIDLLYEESNLLKFNIFYCALL